MEAPEDVVGIIDFITMSAEQKDFYIFGYPPWPPSPHV